MKIEGFLFAGGAAALALAILCSGVIASPAAPDALPAAPVAAASADFISE